MELVVGDVDQPGAEETSPANSQHGMDIQRGQIMVIAVDILDLHSFSDIQSSMSEQTEKNDDMFNLYNIYRVSPQKWGFVFWATFEGLKRPQIKKL